MLIGIPKEVKVHEYRVGLTPAGVRELSAHGHHVIVQTQAGGGIGFDDEAYRAAGATIVETAAEIFATADMIVKVKEPQEPEYRMLREGQILFTYLHLASDLPQTRGLLDSGCVAFAYETVTDERGGLPLLAPMSEVAGRMSVQAGARAMEKSQGGNGLLIGGVPGVEPAKVLVIGGGVVGSNAARIAAGMGANVTVLDRSLPRLAYLDSLFGGRINTICSTIEAIESHLREADLVIGAVLIPGALAPKLVSRKQLRLMRRGTVVVDVAIDQGGCFETSRPTTHDHPTYVEEDVVHYCVANMPGGVSRTSTLALTNATLSFALEIADKGYARAALDNPHLLNGLNVYRGQLTFRPVAEATGINYQSPRELLQGV